MSRRLPGVAPALRALALCAALAGRARADGFSAQAEPTFSNFSTRTTDQSGAVTTSDSTSFQQRYRGNMERSFFPLLRLSLDGLYEWQQGWTKNEGAPTIDTDARRWSIGSRLTLGGPVLNGGVSYEQHRDSSEQRLAGETLRVPTFVRDILGAYATWRPADLPSLDLHFGRTHNYDLARRATDQVTDDILLSSGYQPDTSWDIRYSARYSNPDDRLHGTDTTEVTQSARATWNDRFLDGRGTAYVSYGVGTDSSRTTVTKAGGVVLTQAIPAAGFSAVERFPALPNQVKLAQNPALIDGNTSAGAGLNLGFSASAGSDVSFRDVGAQFPNLLSPVNTIYVWVDQPLPADVSGALAWTAWQSADNQTWTEVALAGPVVFSEFQNRFEISIQRVQATYFKVTTRPLPVAVTTDPRFASILVTEIQLFDAVVASLVAARGAQTRFSGQLNGSGRLVLLKDPDLVYDSSILLTHVSNPFRTTWSAVNGLSVARRLSPILLGTARAERADSDLGAGHEGQLRWSASLSAEPLPTLGAGLTYGGQLSQLRAGDATSHSATLFSRADLYQGVSVIASTGANVGTTERGQDSRGLNVTAGATITPHRTLTMTGGYTLSTTISSGGGTPPQSDHRRNIEGTMSFSPFPALYLTASVSRFTTATQAPGTLTSFAAGFSPFPGGDLVARFSYNETLDSASGLHTRLWGPSLRWNVRPGIWTDVNYTISDSRTPALDSRSRALFASLNIALR